MPAFCSVKLRDSCNIEINSIQFYKVMRVGLKQLVSVIIPIYNNAKGELVTLLDSVDLWLPGKLENIYDTLLGVAT